jgi:hypothetical protein
VIVASGGYVMSGQPCFAAHRERVECFWSALGDIRSTPAYRELVKSYNHGLFVE